MRYMRRWTKVLVVALGVALIAVVGGAQWSSAADTGTSATYEGGTINLAQGWGTAAVCAVTAAGTAESKAGDSARPVQITRGNRTKITTR